MCRQLRVLYRCRDTTGFVLTCASMSKDEPCPLAGEDLELPREVPYCCSEDCCVAALRAIERTHQAQVQGLLGNRPAAEAEAERVYNWVQDERKQHRKCADMLRYYPQYPYYVPNSAPIRGMRFNMQNLMYVADVHEEQILEQDQQLQDIQPENGQPLPNPRTESNQILQRPQLEINKAQQTSEPQTKQTRRFQKLGTNHSQQIFELESQQHPRGPPLPPQPNSALSEPPDIPRLLPFPKSAVHKD